MDYFFCKECGYETTKWTGKCPVCQGWNTFKEADRLVSVKKGKQKSSILNPVEATELLAEINVTEEQRIQTGIKEFDGVLGGGIVPGMVILIGGEPGIGKSTLMMQIADRLGNESRLVLYVSGEESKQQIKLRSSRMGVDGKATLLFCSNSTEDVISAISKIKPHLVIIDSIQSMATDIQSSFPGSISQVRESTMLFTRIAKQNNIPFVIIGHITKDGAVAGPKLIEHLVDTVLYFEGDSKNQYKILKSNKNRFGSTNEIGVFEMTQKGLLEVENPSHLFLNDNNHSIGSAVGCVLEGTRSFLIEVQALVSPAVYGTAARIALGFDGKKLSIILAVIEKLLALKIRQNDIFINIAGGIKINDPSLDLALVAAIISGYENKEVTSKSVFIGEVGLNGEVRPVGNIDKRIKEAVKLGYERIIISDKTKSSPLKANIIKLHNISHIYPHIFSN